MHGRLVMASGIQGRGAIEGIEIHQTTSRIPTKMHSTPSVPTTVPKTAAPLGDRASSISGNRPKKKMLSPSTTAMAPSAGAAYPKRVHRPAECCVKMESRPRPETTQLMAMAMSLT